MKSSKFFFVFSFCAISILYLCFLFPSPEYSAFNKDDSSYFVVFALNLSQYGRYSLDCFPQEEWGRHGTWPPVFPILLTIPTLVFGLNWWVLKLIMVAISLLSLFFLHSLLNRLNIQNAWVPVFTVVMVAVNPFFFLFGHLTMTEIPFILVTLLCLQSILKIHGPASSFNAGCLCGFGFWVRGYAILFLPVIFFYIISNRSWNIRFRIKNIIACFIPIFFSVAAWTIGSKVFVNSQPDSFTEHYGTLAGLSNLHSVSVFERLKQCVWWHLPNLAQHFLPVLPGDFFRSSILGLLIGALGLLWVGFGGFICMKKGDRLIVPWTATGMIFIVFVGLGNLRYTLTYLPFIYYLHWVAFDYVLDRLQIRKSLMGFALAFPIFLVSSGLVHHLCCPDRLRFLNSGWKDYSSAMVWCKANLPVNSIIVSRSAHTAYGGSGIRSLSFTEDVYQIVVKKKEDYPVSIYWVVDMSDPDSGRYLQEFLSELTHEDNTLHADPSIVFSKGSISIYRVETNPG